MREDETQIERAIARAFGAGRRISRRRFMRQTGRGVVLAGSALTLQSILAACGIRPAGSASTAPAGGPLEWANWPAYIDIDDDGNYPSLVTFTEETGHRGQLHRGDPGQRRLLRNDPPGPTGWQPDRVGHHLARRLGHRAHGAPRIPRGARPQQAAELDGELRRLREGPLVRPREQAQPVLAGRHHRHRIRPGADRARDHELRRPPRSGVRRTRWAASATCATCSG